MASYCSRLVAIIAEPAIVVYVQHRGQDKGQDNVRCYQQTED